MVVTEHDTVEEGQSSDGDLRRRIWFRNLLHRVKSYLLEFPKRRPEAGCTIIELMSPLNCLVIREAAPL